MTYWNFLWKAHRNFLLFSTIFLALFQFLILRLVTTIEGLPMIKGMLDQVPENIQAIFGQNSISMLTVEGAAALGLNHPLVLVILGIAAIMIPSRHIAGEAETGTLELLLSFPIERWRLLLNLFFSQAAFLFLIVLAATSSSLLSTGYYHQLTLDLSLKILGIGLNLWFLFVFLTSLAMAFSSFAKEGIKVVIRMAGVMLIFYLLHYLSSLWEDIHFFKPFNFFSYYQPIDLMSGERSFLQNYSVLTCLIAVCLLIGLHRFNRRDIPG